MGTLINVTQGGDELLSHIQQLQQAGRLVLAQQRQRDKLSDERGKVDEQQQERNQELEPLPYARDPAARRTGSEISFLASGFNSPVTAQTQSNGATFQTWNQVAAGALRFVVGGNRAQTIEQQVPTYSNGFSLRETANPGFVYSRGWSYQQAGSHPPVAEMALAGFFNTWGGRYIAPRHPMVTSSNGVLWLTWEYRLDVATQYTLSVEVAKYSPYSLPTYSLNNSMLFVRFDTRSNNLQSKFYHYSQTDTTTSFATRYLNNCWPDDPAKDVRAQLYRGEYHVKAGRAKFLRALSTIPGETSPSVYVYPYEWLQDANTGKVTPESWRVDEYEVDTSSPAALASDLQAASQEDPSATLLSQRPITISSAQYSTAESSLFKESLVAPVPDGAGGLRNTLLPTYVIN